MKPRSPVTALLALTESLLAARAARKAARTKQASRPAGTSKLARFLSESRPLTLRIKTIS